MFPQDHKLPPAGKKRKKKTKLEIELAFVDTPALINELFNRVDRGVFIWEREIKGTVGSLDALNFVSKGTYASLLGMCHGTLHMLNTHQHLQAFKAQFGPEEECDD